MVTLQFLLSSDIFFPLFALTVILNDEPVVLPMNTSWYTNLSLFALTGHVHV